MKRNLLNLICLLALSTVFAQTKVSGYVFDDYNEPVPFANIIFKNSSEGTITDENGKFYMESDQTWDTLIVSFVGYETLEITLPKKVNYDLKFTLKEDMASLDAVSYTHLTLPTKA